MALPPYKRAFLRLGRGGQTPEEVWQIWYGISLVFPGKAWYTVTEETATGGALWLTYTVSPAAGPMTMRNTAAAPTAALTTADPGGSGWMWTAPFTTVPASRRRSAMKKRPVTRRRSASRSRPVPPRKRTRCASWSRSSTRRSVPSGRRLPGRAMHPGRRKRPAAYLWRCSLWRSCLRCCRP
jgi:hypothetical protein